MGKQNKKERIIKVNPQKMGGRRQVAACTEELQAFFACLSRSGTSFDEKCAKERHDLTACATAAVSRRGNHFSFLEISLDLIMQTYHYYVRRLENRKLPVQSTIIYNEYHG
jgi:hypothetical protein